jgi:CMP-N-acetylneuraminic acid synthetase/2-polyprenyl-3-methyl-5-hydroxy-6-metoxy-1,4-benzoquinol methylase
MTTIDNIMILPLRGGSKRISNKNIKLLLGKPLFCYQLECALSVSRDKKIVVISDNNYYLNIAKTYKDVETLSRPESISKDKSKTEDVIEYVLNYYYNNKVKFNNIVLLQATSPLTKKKWIEEGVDKINKWNFNSIVTYCDFDRFFLDSLDIIDRPMTQDIEPKKLETGCFWITRVKGFLLNKNRLVPPIGEVKVSRIAGMVDIDHEEDLIIAECLLKKDHKKYFRKRVVVNKIKDSGDYWDLKTDPDGMARDLKNETERSERRDFYKKEVQYINSLPNKTGKMFLDLGCGPGFISSEISDEYIKHGLDNSKTAVQYASKYIENLHLGVLNVDTYPDEFFDVVLCFHVIEHVNDPIRFIRNISNILKTHGELIISTPDFDSAMARRYGEKYRMLNDEGHISLFSVSGLVDALSDNGFFVEKIDYPYFETKYFNKSEIGKVFDNDLGTSPAFYGNVFTCYCKKK